MSRNTKIILGFGATVLVFCGLLCVLAVIVLPRAMQNAFGNVTTKGGEVGRQIADYRVPPGYKEQGGMDLVFEKLVTLVPENDNGPIIMLFQINTPGMNRQQLEQQMRQSFQQSFGQGGSYQQVGTRDVTLQGQPTTLSVSESALGNYTMRQATGVFKGKGGTALIMVSGRADEWDWPLIENFCKSIQ